jgi:hypothetical protein
MGTSMGVSMGVSIVSGIAGGEGEGIQAADDGYSAWT